MMVNEEKEVRYDLYCRKCVNWETDEQEEPCNECLTTPVNLYSKKPIRFEESTDAKKG